MRAVCPAPRILLMSGIFRGEADTVIDRGLTPVVWEPWQLDLLEEAAVGGAWLPGRLRCIWKLIPGCRARGCAWRRLVRCCARFQEGSCLRLEGVMTHFSAPENMSSVRPNPQLAGLEQALELIVSAGCGRSGCMPGTRPASLRTDRRL